MNSPLRERLAQCFAVAFPKLPPSQIIQATVDNVAGWDSISSQNLLGLIEEEFQVAILPEDIPELTSFLLIEDYLMTSFDKGLSAKG